MFNKIISFSSNKKYLSLKENYPEHVKLNIPEWFKKLEHSPDAITIKGCMPFLETLTTGYLLRLPQDFHLKHNCINNNDLRESSMNTASIPISEVNLNDNFNKKAHPTQQLKGSPLIKKNLNFEFNKILNPWKIKTPPGYSCLFVPPLNNSDDRFSIIPGIVHTDKYKLEINFPFCVNGDKYPVLNTILKNGTPYVQVIPFKRESWKMEIKENKGRELIEFKFFLKMFRNYQFNIWEKITWK